MRQVNLVLFSIALNLFVQNSYANISQVQVSCGTILDPLEKTVLTKARATESDLYEAQGRLEAVLKKAYGQRVVATLSGGNYQTRGDWQVFFFNVEIPGVKDARTYSVSKHAARKVESIYGLDPTGRYNTELEPSRMKQPAYQ